MLTAVAAFCHYVSPLGLGLLRCLLTDIDISRIRTKGYVNNITLDPPTPAATLGFGTGTEHSARPRAAFQLSQAMLCVGKI